MAFQVTAQNHKLTIHFEGMDSDRGHVLVRIVDADEKEVGGHSVRIKNGEATLDVSLASGQYAVSAFHDANDNKKLDTNWMGIPNEKYGFSNNARGTFGPPALKDQLISLTQDKRISITLK